MALTWWVKLCLIIHASGKNEFYKIENVILVTSSGSCKDAIKRFLLPCLKIAFTLSHSLTHDLKLPWVATSHIIETVNGILLIMQDVFSVLIAFQL